LLVYEANTLRVTKFVHIDSSNQYMAMIRATWGARLKQVFAEIPDPTWFDSYVPPGAPRLQTEIGQPVRAPRPAFVEADAQPASPMQLVAGHAGEKAAR
jgi:putative proteasome-type protease